MGGIFAGCLLGVEWLADFDSSVVNRGLGCQLVRRVGEGEGERWV